MDYRAFVVFGRLYRLASTADRGGPATKTQEETCAFSRFFPIGTKNYRSFSGAVVTCVVIDANVAGECVATDM